MLRYGVVLLALVACGKKPADKGTPGNAKAGAKLPIPTVAIAEEQTTAQGTPPVLVFVDQAGKASVAVSPAAWTGLGSVDVTKGKPVDFEELDKLVHVGKLEGWTPKQIVEHVGKDFEIPNSQDPIADDPPPPPDDDTDESGGTGTAMALDDTPKPKTPREEHFLAAGGFRVSIFNSMAGDLDTPITDGFGPGDKELPLKRVSDIGGEALKGESLPRQQAILFIDPHAKLDTLMMCVGLTDPAIAVEHDGKVAPLRVNFLIQRELDVADMEPPWIEVRALPGGSIELEAVPGKPVVLDKIDAIKTELPKLVADAKRDPWNPVDILVPADMDAQHIIDFVVAVDQAGAHAIGIGKLPDAKVLALRGKPPAGFTLGQPMVDGDLDRAVVRRTIKRNLMKLNDCYAAAHTKDPALKERCGSSSSSTRPASPRRSRAMATFPTLGNASRTR